MMVLTIAFIKEHENMYQNNKLYI